MYALYIVLFLHQTTTWFKPSTCKCSLYIVLFLHQTTTQSKSDRLTLCCISYYSYIKPQPGLNAQLAGIRCISYYSYIKPQLQTNVKGLAEVVYRTIPTSNHNFKVPLPWLSWLYIVLFLHQTTTYNVDIADKQHVTITFINKKWQSRK